MGDGDIDVSESGPIGEPRADIWAPPTSAPAGWYPNPAGVGSVFFDGRRWQPTDSEGEQRYTLPLVAGLGLYGVLVVSLIVERFLSPTIVSQVNSLTAFVLAMIFVLLLGYGPALVWVAQARDRWGNGRWSSVGWRWKRSDLGWGLLAGFVALVVEVAMFAIVKGLDIPTRSNLQLVGSGEPNWIARVVLVVLIVVLAPIIEELMFRGVIMASLLSRMRTVFAVGVQGVMFGLVHFEPTFGVENIGLIVILSSVGCVFGAASYLSRSLGSSVIAHAVVNGAALAALLSR